MVLVVRLEVIQILIHGLLAQLLILNQEHIHQLQTVFQRVIIQHVTMVHLFLHLEVQALQ